MKEAFTPNGIMPNLGSGMDQRTSKGGAWGIYGRPFSSYLKEFDRLSFRDDVAQALLRTTSQDRPVVVDFMAPPFTLRDFHMVNLQDKTMKGIAVGLADQRTDEEKDLDTLHGVSYVAGNLRSDFTWKKISYLLGDDKVDLVLELGYGGLSYLPTTVDFQFRSVLKIWQMLNPNQGAALVQLPPARSLDYCGIPINKWLNRLEEGGIQYRYDATYDSRDLNAPYGFLMITKSDSSQRLPRC